ncbi:MAG: GDYXXLXY domain-containing protein [Candidatus Kapabacteria bacterium]|nr:GDYXXLXY domain-containing protein [Candidatus Kapabacteria bacterium]
MKNKKLLLSIFIIVAIAQLFVPAKMILDREDVLKTGKEFKFIAAPVDPSDPFRGKYISLSFQENTVGVNDKKTWVNGEKSYIILTTDEKGNAKIKSVTKIKPTEDIDFVTIKISYGFSTDESDSLVIAYPFDRFYMKESKAQRAELKYRQSIQDSSKVTYASVYVKNGEAVLKDVLIDGISINELLKSEK